MIAQENNLQMNATIGQVGNETVTEEDVVIDLSFMHDSKLVLYNDDHNSFDKVIMALIIYCQMSSAKAMETATKIHLDGKAIVKYASRDKLEPIAKVFGELDLTCEIEDP